MGPPTRNKPNPLDDWFPVWNERDTDGKIENSPSGARHGWQL